jgi:hypothetical protein
MKIKLSERLFFVMLAGCLTMLAVIVAMGVALFVRTTWGY